MKTAWIGLALIGAVSGMGLQYAASAKSSVAASKPAAADEAAVRKIIAHIYYSYTHPAKDEDAQMAAEGATKDDLPYTASLNVLLKKWEPIASGDELYELNDFDWFCQCQDNDPKKAHIVSQKYIAHGRDAMDANIVYSAGWGKGSPLTYMFKRESGAWKIDDMRFDAGRRLRQGLVDDVKDAAKDAAKKTQ